MSGTFVKRKIDVTFTLGNNIDENGYVRDPTKPAQPKFLGTDSNQVTLSGLRVTANLTQGGSAALGNLQLRVFGMTATQMAQLSTLGKLPIQIGRNVVSLSVGDDVNGMATIFQGNVTDAFQDFNAAPEVGFQVSAYSGGMATLGTAKPTSYNATVDAATVLADLAGRANWLFENNGVSVQLSYPYYSGTIGDQIKECCIEAHVDYLIDQNKLIVWPKGGTRKGSAFVISPQTTLIGYPTYNPMGVSINTLHQPGITCGSKIQLVSSLQAACGFWQVYSITSDLESETPGGSWFSQLECAVLGQVPTE